MILSSHTYKILRLITDYLLFSYLYLSAAYTNTEKYRLSSLELTTQITSLLRCSFKDSYFFPIDIKYYKIID